MIPALWQNQQETVAKAARCEGFMDFSDPGTGKTRAHLQGFADAGGRLLVVATKSILQPAWGNDIDHYFPGMTYVVANANNREKAFKAKADVVITNHDAAVWLLKNKKLLASFDRLIIDESTAYKNPQSQRSKAIKTVAPMFKWRRTLSGTPNPNTILEIWHQALLADGGERLGNSYWKFRSVACEPVQVGPNIQMVEWRDKPGIEQTVFDLLSDISIRHKLEDCISIPPNSVRRVDYELPSRCRTHYEDMVRHAQLLIANDAGVQEINAINAASVATKLAQIASGAMYTGVDDDYVVLDDGRTELIMDLIEERKHSLVAFQWRHQKEQLIAAATKRGYRFAVIDGSVHGDDRNKAVKQFQDGELRVIFAHPQSAGHGLTLTKGTATIWASPTWNAEHFKQFNARIHRAGQQERTETILVCAKDTIDERVYAGLDKKLTSMQLLLDLMEAA